MERKGKREEKGRGRIEEVEEMGEKEGTETVGREETGE